MILFIYCLTTQSVAHIIVYCRVTGRLVNCKFKRTRQGIDVEQLEALKRPRKVINISGRTVIIQVKLPTTSHESHHFRQFAQHTENNCHARAESLQWIRSCLWFPVTLAQAQQRLFCTCNQLFSLSRCNDVIRAFFLASVFPGDRFSQSDEILLSVIGTAYRNFSLVMEFPRE
jgi:hypothetical protein